MQLRRTLACCHQNEKSVAEYTHELQDLFNMIGNIPKQDQVLKFWNSARPSIQKELWRNKLNPELSSWRKVVAQAEIIEIAENVAKRRDWKAGQHNQASGSGGNNPRHKPHLADGSVHAVTLDHTRNAQINIKASQTTMHKEGNSKNQHLTPGMELLWTGQLQKEDQYHQINTIITIEILTKKGHTFQTKKRQNIGLPDSVLDVEKRAHVWKA